MKFEIFEDANKPVLRIATDHTLSENGECYLQNEVCQVPIHAGYCPRTEKIIAYKRAEYIRAALNNEIEKRGQGFPNVLHDDPDFVDSNFQ